MSSWSIYTLLLPKRIYIEQNDKISQDVIDVSHCSWITHHHHCRCHCCCYCCYYYYYCFLPWLFSSFSSTFFWNLKIKMNVILNIPSQNENKLGLNIQLPLDFYRTKWKKKIKIAILPLKRTMFSYHAIP